MGGGNNDGGGRIYPADWATKTKGQKQNYWKRRRQSGKGPPRVIGHGPEILEEAGCKSSVKILNQEEIALAARRL